MGKSWKTRAHLNTGYPYNPIRAANLQVLRPKYRHEDEGSLFLDMYGEAGHPVFSQPEFATSSRDLKHLDFLRAYGQYYFAKLAHVYSSSRECLPASCKAGLSSIESRVLGLSAPLIDGLQNSGERVLCNLDGKVDAVMRVFHAKAALAEGQEGGEHSPAYLARLEESLQLVKERGVTGTARQVVAAVLKRLEESYKGPSEAGSSLQLTAADADAWERLVAHPTVSRLLERAQPSIQYTQKKYESAHDAVVASAAYSRTVEAAAEVLQRVADSALYRLAAERLYPAISGIADPALERLANSAYTRAVVQHLKPIPKEGARQCAVAC